MANEKVTATRFEGAVNFTQKEGNLTFTISPDGLSTVNKIKHASTVWFSVSGPDGTTKSEVMAMENGHVWVKQYDAMGRIKAENEFDGKIGKDMVAGYNQALANGAMPSAKFDAIQDLAQQALQHPKNPNPGPIRRSGITL